MSEIFTKKLTKEDIERGYVLFGDKKVVVLHGDVGDVFSLGYEDDGEVEN